MKPQLLGGRGPALAPLLCGSEAMRSIQEELVAAIHEALEAAVEIAVREVRTLVGQATINMYEELRRDNESLKEKLQRAEQLLDCVQMEEEDSSDRRRDGAPHPASCGPNTNGTTEIRGEPAGGHSCLALDHREVSRRSDRDVTQPDTDGQEKPHKDVLKIEGVIKPCRNLQAPESEAPLRTSLNSTLEQVTIKQEELEEERTPICLDVVKDESLISDSINWPSEETDIHSQDPKVHLLDERVDQAGPPNISSSLTSHSDLQLISPEFSNIHLEQASVSQALPQVQGSHIKTGRSITTIPMCKLCGQTFPLPSLLRRHYGQCSLRLQQRGQPPQGGGTKTRLQLYPPGCSPFCCTVCSRDFNRLENLKTHLRIHTGERPYTCSVCLKCFRHSGALTRHFRIHTGEKPYVCGQCGKSFRNCGGLKLHQRSHSRHLQ